MLPAKLGVKFLSMDAVNLLDNEMILKVLLEKLQDQSQDLYSLLKIFTPPSKEKYKSVEMMFSSR
jgi:hypothetical protein